jgi:hypothetical protein
MRRLRHGSRLGQYSTAGRCGLYTAGMIEDTGPGDETAEPEKLPALPRHLSALIGSLKGPADLGRNHDKYLTYADREEAGGAASA